MCYSLVVIFGQRLDLMILEVISNLYDSMMLWHIIHTDKMHMAVHEFYERFHWKIYYVAWEEQLWNSCWKKKLFCRKLFSRTLSFRALSES